MVKKKTMNRHTAEQKRKGWRTMWQLLKYYTRKKTQQKILNWNAPLHWKSRKPCCHHWCHWYCFSHCNTVKWLLSALWNVLLSPLLLMQFTSLIKNTLTPVKVQKYSESRNSLHFIVLTSKTAVSFLNPCIHGKSR